MLTPAEKASGWRASNRRRAAGPCPAATTLASRPQQKNPASRSGPVRRIAPWVFAAARRANAPSKSVAARAVQPTAGRSGEETTSPAASAQAVNNSGREHTKRVQKRGLSSGPEGDATGRDRGRQARLAVRKRRQTIELAHELPHHPIQGRFEGSGRHSI